MCPPESRGGDGRGRPKAPRLLDSARRKHPHEPCPLPPVGSAGRLDARRAAQDFHHARGDGQSGAGPVAALGETTLDGCSSPATWLTRASRSSGSGAAAAGEAGDKAGRTKGGIGGEANRPWAAVCHTRLTPGGSRPKRRGRLPIRVSRLDPGQVPYVGDRPEEAGGRSDLPGVGCGRVRALVPSVLRQPLGVAENGVERRAKPVAQDGQEHARGLVRRLCHGACRLGLVPGCAQLGRGPLHSGRPTAGGLPAERRARRHRADEQAGHLARLLMLLRDRKLCRAGPMSGAKTRGPLRLASPSRLSLAFSAGAATGAPGRPARAATARSARRGRAPALSASRSPPTPPSRARGVPRPAHRPR